MPDKTSKIINALDNCPENKYDYNTSFGVLKPHKELKDINNLFPRIE